MKSRNLFFAISAIILSNIAIAQLPYTEFGLVERLENFPSDYVTPRHIDIWTPEGYNKAQQYQVLYMHDGQMLFDSTQTWNKQEWKVDEIMSMLINNETIEPCIVIGIHNSTERHADYFPQKAFQILPEHIKDGYMPKDSIKRKKSMFPQGPHADDYLKFIVKELKPYVDKSYSTKSSAANTHIAGSSMGGLISMYAMFEYPEIFGSAACISTHWIGGITDNSENPVPAAFKHYISNNIPPPETHKIYFDHGTLGLDYMYKVHQLNINDVMKDAGYIDGENLVSEVHEGHDHTELYWSKRLDGIFKYLLN